MRARIHVAAVAAVCALPAAAQEADPSLERFHAFFQQFMDSEWSYHTRMTGPDGNVVFEGEDVRTYSFGIRDRFAIENVYKEEDDGSRTHVAVQLLGIDARTGLLSLSSFWPWQSTAIADVSIEMRDVGGDVRLVGKGTPAGLDYPRVSFECRFENADRYRCVADTTMEDGTEYRSNVETFERRGT